jgi:hypothetical protein
LKLLISRGYFPKQTQKKRLLWYMQDLTTRKIRERSIIFLLLELNDAWFHVLNGLDGPAVRLFAVYRAVSLKSLYSLHSMVTML